MQSQESLATKATILIVDDTLVNISVLVGLLKDNYRTIVAKDGEQALNRIYSGVLPDLILLDIMMPGIDGYEVCSRLKADARTKHIPIIFISAMSNVGDEAKGLELGAVDYITKPISPPIVLARVKTHLALFNQQKNLEAQVEARTQELANSRKELIRRLGLAAEYKDNETGLHVQRMAEYTRLVALELGFSPANAETLASAAPMHDIGKLGIPDAILCKPGKLTDEEFEVIKSHPLIGAQILEHPDSELLTVAREVALYHHEKWDGSGYPEGLSGENIPITARIASIADVYDALISVRPYKKAWSTEQALALFEEQKGKHFDPNVVEAFKRVLPQVIEIQKRLADKA
ncbi:response regulator receiver modulated metal dependent phosphohydrolase [Oceanospirillum multiglobuliferum]|uniref:Two-component system response regulator n=1 Tax=Oceanospirillum multiglobuliferum TaxID=64969 RepID=A0A1T4PE48_9GAMM|nr:two-component system response regulator [Oceanospirillum multiglobuliferum]OPX55607.1 two-component system response regulator [Oceanospirillum multiglobuliferum]SJZ89088.1 response regulator receiver modulated metal dependent phosphohydrolase [Oceanospirillum multiglobuliferum]